MPGLYELLEVLPTASKAEIHDAYGALFARLDPIARGGDRAAADRIHQAYHAYTVLMDPDQRRAYDGNLPPGEGDLPVLPCRMSPAGSFQILVPFRLACLGGRAQLEIDGKRAPISVPVGVEDGTEGRIGSHRVTYKVSEDKMLKRRGRDIHMQLVLNGGQAARGVEASVESLTGWVNVKVPRLVYTGQVLRLKGKGIALPGEEPGNFLIEIKVAGSSTPLVKKVGLGDT